MGFLRRALAGSKNAPAETWASSPEWAGSLKPQEFEYLAELVQKELGRTRIPNAASLREFAVAAELSLPNLLPALAKLPTDRWPAFIHAFYERGRSFREAGDAVEARAQTFEAAATVLRIHWMPRAMAPAGDVAIEGPIPDTVEVLALDAGTSMRHVSERLFRRWGETVDEAVRVARERVLELPLTRSDLATRGNPAVRVISLEGEGPWAGALLAGLDRVDPAAIGAFGTLVGAPVENALVYCPLNASASLRDDLVELAAFTFDFAKKQAEHGFLTAPIWRRRDGRTRTVRFQLSDDLELLGSHDPGFAGVLAALDPLGRLEVPGWAQGKLSPDQYVRFAGCVSATLGFATPEEVAKLGSGLNLAPLAEACGSAPFATWLGTVEEHLQGVHERGEDTRRLAGGAVEDRDDALAGLVTWIDAPAADPAAELARPVGETGFVEVLGVMANGSARGIKPSAALGMGPADDLFERGRAAIRASLVVAPSTADRLSGLENHVSGQPSPTAAIPHLMTWLPDVVGPYGALVAVGDAWRLDVLPIHDASAVLDLPGMLGAAAGATMAAEWPLPPSVFWLRTGALDVFHIEVSDGIVTGVTSSADLAGIVARLPVGPRRLPPGLEDILGPDGGLRFYGLLHAAVVERLANDPASLAEFAVPSIRQLAGRCRPHPPAAWAQEIRAWMDEMAAPRRELDLLTLATDYAAVEPALGLRVARRELAGSQLAREAGGGLTVYPVIGAGGRARRVTHAMLDRWRVDAERCHRDAAARTALAPDLVDEPMYLDQPSIRQVYGREIEREAAGLCLHLRYPGTRRGFIVSITHGSRAHYIRLDDPGAIALVPVFAQVIAGIYVKAAKAADAHTPWLLWLTPDGRVIELFDTTKPLPPRDRLPAELVAMMEAGKPTRPH